MKAARLMVAVVTGFTAMALHAQDAAPPTVDLGARKPDENMANPTASPTPSLPDVSKLDEIFHQNSLGKEADERKFHIEWRRLANQAINDPDVIAAKAEVKRAGT